MENFNTCAPALNSSGLTQYLKNFIYSKSFVSIIAVICAFSYVSGLNLGCIFALLIIGGLILATSRDITPVSPILFFITFAVSNRDVFGNPLVFLVFVPGVIGVIIRLIRFPVKFSLGVLTIPLILMLSAFILGGVRTENYLPFFESVGSADFGEYMAIVVGLGIGMLFEYLMLRHGFSNEHAPKWFNVKTYIAFMLSLAGVLVGVELAYEKYIVADEFLYMGYGNTNLVGCVLLLSIPAGWYLLAKSNNLPKVIVAIFNLVLLYAFVLMTSSDGCLGVTLVFTVAIAVYTYFVIKPKRRALYLNCVLSIALIGVLGILALSIFKTEYFNELLNKLFSDTGRSNIYEQAFIDFKLDWLFGAGLFYPFIHSPYMQHNYHSSFIHVLATTGVYGLICFVIYLVARLLVLAKNKTHFNFYMLLSFICYEAYATIDTGEFVMTMILVIGTIALTEGVNKLPENELPLKNLV